MLDLTTILNSISARQTDFPFRPVKCKEADLLDRAPVNGFLYFTIDTHKIYYGYNNEYVAMGGTSGIYYGKRQMTDDEKYGDQVLFNFNPEDIDASNLPAIDDLILNIPDGGFYRVLDASPTLIETQRLVIAGGGGGGTGAGNNEGSLSVNFITPQYSSTIVGVDYSIEFEIIAKDSAGDTIREEGIATWKINGREYTQKVYNGKNSFKIDEYLNSSVEQNKIILIVNMNTGGSKNTIVSKTWYVTAINLTLDWPWTYSEQEYRKNSTFTLKFYPYGNIDCKAHISLDGGFEKGVNYFIESIPADKTGDEFTTQPMPSLTHGAHSCEIWLTATINGEEYETPIIKHDITFVDENSVSTILTVPFYVTTATQYDALSIPFLVYNNTKDKCSVSFYVNDVRIGGDEYDRSLHYWPYTLSEYGTVSLSIRSDDGDMTKDIELIVNRLNLPHAEASGAAFSLKASTLSSNQELRNWNSNGVTLTFSDNFDWNRGGINFETMPDGSIEKFIRVRQGTRMWINYQLFKNFTTGTSGGKNFKLCFKATNCYDYEAPVLSCMNYRYEQIALTAETHQAYTYYTYNNVTSKYELDINNFDNTKTYYKKIPNDVGLIFDAQKANFRTATHPDFATQYCENSYIEVEAEIWPKVEDRIITEDCTIYGDRFLMLWVDGVPAGVKPYSTGMPLTQINPQIIEIGSDLCDVLVYCAKAYERKLSFNEHIDNFIMDAPSSIKMMERYRRNDILDTRGEISYEKLVKANPGCRAYLYDIPRMTTYKEDKVDGCTYYELTNDYSTLDTPYIKGENVRTYVQGTSSAAYGVAAFNLRSDFTKKGKIYDKNGNKMDGWKVSPDDLPIDIACTKVNVASCENANNVVNAEWYNRFQPYWDAHRRKGYSLNQDGTLVYNPYRDCMKFHTGVVFIRDNNTNLNYLNAKGEPDTALYLKANTFLDEDYVSSPYFKMYSIGNMGNDKKNINIFHDITNPRAACVEVKDNQNEEHWMTIINNNAFDAIIIGKDDEGKDIVDGPFYEFRYGVSENDDMADNAQGITEASQREDFMRLVEWMARHDPNPYDPIEHPFGYTGELLEEPVTFDTNYIFRGFDPPGYEGKVNPSEISLKGLEISKYKGKYTHDTKDYRIASMLYECENYLVMDSVVFHYLYILRHTMVDNVAKNTFWSTEDGLHWDLTKNYDNDTSDGNDNSGNLTYTYGLEYGDFNSDGKDVFNATPSVWITFINELFDAQKYLWKELEKKGAWDAQPYLEEFKKHQSVIPERCWIADYQRKYIRPRQLGLDEQTYLSKLEGGCKTHQRNQFETYQEFYMNSKFVAGTPFTDGAALEFRLNKNPSESWDTSNILPISFYINCYGSIHLGGQLNTSGRLSRKQIWNAPVGQMVAAPSDATCYVYGASMIQSMSGFDRLYPGYAKLNGASKLLSIELGSNEPDYYNARLTSVNAGSNTMLQKFQMRNSGTVSGTNAFGELSLIRASRLNELLLSGSAVKELALADGASTTILELNALTTLTLDNLLDLQTIRLDDGIYTSIKNLYVNNCPKLDEYTYEFAKASQLQRYHLTDFHWIITNEGKVDYELSDDFNLDEENNVTGLIAIDNLMDENTKPKEDSVESAALSGLITIKIPCKINEHDLYVKYIKTYPNVTIEYDDVVKAHDDFIPAATLIFKKLKDSPENHYRVLANAQDGEQSISDLISVNGPTGIAMTIPSKDSTTAETFTFTGYWIDAKDDETKYYDPNTFIGDVAEDAISFANIFPKENMTFYPEYIQATRQYNVRFYDWTPSLIPQVQGGVTMNEWPVNYNTVYNGPMTNYHYRSDSDLNDYSRYTFLGWSLKYVENGLVQSTDAVTYVDLGSLIVTNTINLYACYKIEDVRNIETDIRYFSCVNSTNGYEIKIKDEYKNVLEGKITLPSQYNGNDIVMIADNGFKETTKISHVFFKIDAKYTKVGKYGFANSNIKMVDLPPTIRIIDDYAFQHCVELKQVTLNDNITTIGTYAFAGANNQHLQVQINKLPDNLTVLGSFAFIYAGPNVTISELPIGLSELKTFTFNQCENVRILTIPETMTLQSNALAYSGISYKNSGYEINVYISAATTEEAQKKIGQNAFDNHLGGKTNSLLRYKFHNMNADIINDSYNYWGLQESHVQDIEA